MRRWLDPPVFPDPELTTRAGMLHEVARLIILVVFVLVPLVAVVQPETIWRAVLVLTVVLSAGLAALELNRRGHYRMAAWTVILAIIALLTLNALPAGGIRSPGIQAYFIFVMLAGLLLGERVGIAVAALVALLGLGLVVLESAGLLPAQRYVYGAPALWLITNVYIVVALLVMRLATRTVSTSLDRARAELDVRRAAEERLAHALDVGAIGVFEHDLQARTFRGDARAIAMTGLVPRADGSIPFEDWSTRVHPDDWSRVADDLARFAGGQPTGRTHFRYTRSDGAERQMESAAYLTLDTQGRPAHLVGLLMDVTERHELTQALNERVKELRLLHRAAELLHSSPTVDEAVLRELVEHMPAAWSHTSECDARINYKGIEVTTAGWRDTPWRQSARFTTSQGDGVVEVAYRTSKPEREEGPFLAEERELLDSLAELLKSRIEREVTEASSRSFEAQLRQAQKMDALGTLAGGVAHDFNNILTAIGGNAQLALANLPAGSGTAESLRDILSAHGRARDLVRRILLFSRREESERKAVQLASVVEEALQLLRAGIPRNVEIRPSLATDLPPVSADASQLHQVIMNLGTNAGYAMKDTGGVLFVTLDTVTVGEAAAAPAPELRRGLHLRLTVRDTGTGMSPDVLERLFEPFFTTKGLAGTGLGMSVVHGIIRDHGGAITAESTLGKGTAFRIYLPVTAAGTAEKPVELAVVVQGAGQHVMYVDDEPTLVSVMGRTLQWLRYRCTTFTDPATALDAFRANPAAFDAVVTDMHMPGMTGVDLARSVRGIRPGVPVAVMSGSGVQATGDWDQAVPPAWITKPATLVELSVALQDMLQKAG